MLGFSTYALSLWPTSIREGLSSTALDGRTQAGSHFAAAAATAAAAFVANKASKQPEQVGMLQWLQEAMQHQQQQQHGIPSAGADPCWLVTGGISMQAAAWAGACSLGLLQNGLTETVEAAAAVQQRCWGGIPDLAEHQQQLGQGSTHWLTQLKHTTMRQPHSTLLLAQLLLCSVEQFSSSGAATFAAVVQQCSSAVELAICAVRFTVDHGQAVQQDHYSLLCEWLDPVLPATLHLMLQCHNCSIRKPSVQQAAAAAVAAMQQQQ